MVTYLFYSMLNILGCDVIFLRPVCGLQYVIILGPKRTEQKYLNNSCYDALGIHISFRAATHRNAVPVLFLITGTPFRSFRHIAAKFRFHLNESDKFALFGSKMPSASGVFKCNSTNICATFSKVLTDTRSFGDS